MKKTKILISTLGVLALLGTDLMFGGGIAQARTGIHVEGTEIVESTGTPLVLRGTSHAHTWYPTRTQAFADIKALGANAVRVVLSGGRWTVNTPTDVADVISRCERNRLICILEDHDTTGYGEAGDARTLAQAVTYWTGLRTVLQGHEDTIIINIGNEPYGNGAASTNWASETSSAVIALRKAGFHHALMVDAPNWGQDWQFIMRDSAQSVEEADPDRNTIFSVHMYGVFDTAAEVTSYVTAFRDKKLPLVIGEFGHQHSDGNPDEATIMKQAIGWLGWSWSGNSGGVEYLDQATGFDATALTDWGRLLFARIAATSAEATVYSSAMSAHAQT